MPKKNYKEKRFLLASAEMLPKAHENYLTSHLKKRPSFCPANPHPSTQDLHQIEGQLSSIKPCKSKEQEEVLNYYRGLNIQIFKVNDHKENTDSEQQSRPCILISQLAESLSTITQRISGLTLLDNFVFTPGNKINEVTLEFKSAVLYCVSFNQNDSKLLTASVKICKQDEHTICLFLMVQRPPTSSMPKPVIFLVKSTPNVLKTVLKTISQLKSEKALVTEVIRLQTSPLFKGAIRVQMIHKSQNFKRGDLAIQHTVKVSDFKIQPLTK